jgi:hypothetical protein
MASELFFCEICGIQVRRVGDGVNPLPKDFDRACPDHLIEYQARRAIEESKEAEALADGAAAYSRDKKKEAAAATKAFAESPDAPDLPGIDNTLPEEPLPGKPPEPPLGGEGTRTSTSGAGTNVSGGSSTGSTGSSSRRTI